MIKKIIGYNLCALGIFWLLNFTFILLANLNQVIASMVLLVILFSPISINIFGWLYFRRRVSVELLLAYVSSSFLILLSLVYIQFHQYEEIILKQIDFLI